MNPDDVLDEFVRRVAARGLQLYPEQEEAILELLSGSNVILNTPTGSGKSLVASAFHFAALSGGRRSVYTSPIKALVNEKFLALCREFGAENVGLTTGDASVNPEAAILCCTAEILANIALAQGDEARIGAVVMDEFHYYSDAERGWAWQVPLLLLRQSRFLLMSATLGGTAFFERALEKLTGVRSMTVRSDRRPVPLEFVYSETPLNEQVEALLEAGRAPVYLVYFTQRAAAEAAQDLMSLKICSREEKAALQVELEQARFSSPYGKEIRRWLRQGIGVHHAGLLPRYRLLVESLAQRGLLKLICGTDTLGVGINVPIRTVVFTQLWKYDGQKSAILSVRDFRQISGRAGRKGFDDRGYVIVQAPEHVIANKRAEEKASADPRKAKKLVKQRAPEGEVTWDRKTFERLLNAVPEELTSRFTITQGMLLLLFSRQGDGCRAARQLIADSHESPPRQRALLERAWQLFRAMVERQIVTVRGRGDAGPKLRVNLELQTDFSLHQALSLYLIDAVARLDRETPDYALDLLSICEAVVEDPDAILRRQVDRLKTEKLAEMKAADVPYEERMTKLDEIEHPKPLREFLYDSFNVFAAAHPWIGDDTVRPKSVAREMYERYLSFAEYVREYGLQRVEGLLLRHLSQVWKVLAQSVPQSAKGDDVVEMEDYFHELIRGIDSSLMDEWERLRNPQYVAPEAAAKPARPESFDVTRDTAAFRRLARTAVLAFLQDVAAQDWESASSRLETGEAAAGAEGDTLSAGARAISTAFERYYDARGRFRLDPEGRSAKHTHWSEAAEEGTLSLAQVLVDPADDNDWEVRFVVPLAPSRAAARPVLQFDGVAPVGAA